MQTGTFGDLEEKTNALQVILNCFSTKSSFIWRKNSFLHSHPFAGGYKSVPANEKRGDCGDKKEKVMKKPELKSEQNMN